jgi:para-nitrobenzyl esterase
MKQRAPILLGILCILAAGFVAACATIGPPVPAARRGSWSGSPIVMTRYGEIQGYPAAEETWVWPAIPYARPPVGELRWRAPRDPLPWGGRREVRAFNGGCTQFSPILPGTLFGSEDCLYLNIWRPRGGTTGLPVYVWIHGGSNASGSATIVPDYYGTGIAGRAGMVFVSINYRLGPLGWFTHPALRGAASALDASGNYGTLDIIKALQWIRDNIASFGGDPADVTLTGESAGGLNVLSLLIAPPAKGLFHRAIVESGGVISHGMGEADVISQHVLDQLLVRDGKARRLEDARRMSRAMSPVVIRAYLRSKSDRELFRVFQSVTLDMNDTPSVLRDGTVIPREGFDAFSSGTYPNKVPLIIGSNREEMKFMLALGSGVPWPGDLYSAIAHYGSDQWKASAVDGVARRLARTPGQPPVFVYQFAWGAAGEDGKSVLPGDWGGRLGAFHTLEIPFFLGTDTLDALLQILLFSPQNEVGRKALSRAIMRYTATFARYGDPNPPGGVLPAWTPWVNTAGAPKCLVLDVKGDVPDISMTSAELTEDGVLAALRAELAEPVREQTLKYLRASKLPARIP